MVTNDLNVDFAWRSTWNRLTKLKIIFTSTYWGRETVKHWQWSLSVISDTDWAIDFCLFQLDLVSILLWCISCQCQTTQSRGAWTLHTPWHTTQRPWSKSKALYEAKNTTWWLKWFPSMALGSFFTSSTSSTRWLLWLTNMLDRLYYTILRVNIKCYHAALRYCIQYSIMLCLLHTEMLLWKWR